MILFCNSDRNRYQTNRSIRPLFFKCYDQLMELFRALALMISDLPLPEVLPDQYNRVKINYRMTNKGKIVVNHSEKEINEFAKKVLEKLVEKHATLIIISLLCLVTMNTLCVEELIPLLISLRM
jgi:hypothetical protein